MVNFVWHLFARVHRIVASAGVHAATDARAARQMWEASPVSAAILAICSLLAAALAVFLLRLIVKLVRRILSGLAFTAALVGGPVSRTRNLRWIRSRLSRAPGAGVAEYAGVVRRRDVLGVAWLASHAPRGTLFEDHLRAVSALLILQARLPEHSLLRGEAIILGELHSHVPVLAEYLVSQMNDLAEIQRAAGSQSPNQEQMRYPALVDEARRVCKQLTEITRIMPVLIDHALVNPHLERMSRKALDLESLRITIGQLLEIGRI